MAEPVITDEIVEKAAQALHDHRAMQCRALHEVGQPLRGNIYDAELRAEARAALEAALPLIRERSGVQVLVDYPTGEKLAAQVVRHFGDAWAVRVMGQWLSGIVIYDDTRSMWHVRFSVDRTEGFPTRAEAVAHLTRNSIRNPNGWLRDHAERIRGGAQ